ncbi:MAG: YchJ family metal-binding protein [Mobiluncus porci]|uniref:UPF0225 protein FYJ63_03910 n=1 Tax=Mobiluncus porci TaxID=2652278 RepID=A0A7K0K1M2_9ACTO|nr:MULTISPECIES: YchJ family metal-binding protein [Mobiluncus]MCI6584239.1 SEC-C domain-containing protein [Mobiluncus sp.]MDD7540760.1 YchJ family metal-binding protein [Mobiluncus porci]MDY5748322.1 YchJ family metal-binding protein [Mobiluncus porci]MST49387.1 zinc chelation protein SecC [Mobiluncus porci]
MKARLCPCGTGRNYADCCEPLHDGAREAERAEEVMRARYSAFVKRREDYLLRSWHPRTRPAEVLGDTGMTWKGLEILEVRGGGIGEETGEVEFVAHYELGGVRRTLQERSRFVRRGGRWVYLDGEIR